MKNNLQILLKEFLSEKQLKPILARAEELELIIKVRKLKGRWHRETLQKLIKERGEVCEICNLHDNKLTLDHIIPKKVLFDMELDEYYTDESNLQILCALCNSKKGSQLDFSNSKTIVLLEKYIALIKSRGDFSKESKELYTRFNMN